MANVTQNDQRSNAQFGNLIVDFNEGEIQLFDNVNDLSKLPPLKPASNMIVMCNSDSLTVIINEEDFTINSGDLFLYASNQPVDQTDATPEAACNVICLSDHVIQRLLHDKIDVWHRAIFSGRPCITHLPEQIREDLRLYHALIASKIRSQNSHHEIVPTLIRAFLLELCQILEDLQDIHDEVKLSQGKVLFNRFLRLISGNEVKRRPISHYASQLAITPKYLTMLCLKYSDKTASDWIIQYTTEDIRFYLKNSNLSIKEISAKLGFANMSHFGSYVRKHLGVSPSEFRHHR
ncbi:MAG: AraC family transcriptional regulator [Prevotella sp.]|nr:AraC family transcriptional regulator [Prevotella sp.]